MKGFKIAINIILVVQILVWIGVIIGMIVGGIDAAGKAAQEAAQNAANNADDPVSGAVGGAAAGGIVALAAMIAFIFSSFSNILFSNPLQFSCPCPICTDDDEVKARCLNYLAKGQYNRESN